MKFLLDVSSIVNAIHIDQQFVKEIPESSRFFCEIHNIEWGPVFLEMISRKLDKLYIVNHSYKNYLSRRDLAMLKHVSIIYNKIHKKIVQGFAFAG